MSESGHPVAEPAQSTAKTGTVVGSASDQARAEEPGVDRRGPALIKSGHRGNEHRSGLQRTAAAIRTMVPLVQKMLPLLEGNVVSAAANLLAPGLAPTVDLAPLEVSLTKLRGELAAIQTRDAEHDRAFKRLDDQLETMKEALERSAHEQRATAEELGKVRSRVVTFSVIGLVLLAAAIGVNVALFLYVRGYMH